MPASQTADSSPTSSAGNEIVTMDRRRNERRSGNPEATDVGLMEKPRRQKQRRRHIDPTTCERDYNEQEVTFMRAMDDYKRQSGRMFPTCSEVLEVVRSLGYVQLSPEQQHELGLDPQDQEADSVDDDSVETELEEA